MSFDSSDERKYPMYAIEPVGGGGVEGEQPSTPAPDAAEDEADEEAEEKAATA